jgi:hypothetical protein
MTAKTNKTIAYIRVSFQEDEGNSLVQRLKEMRLMYIRHHLVQNR